MAVSLVYRRGPPLLVRNLQGAIGARRGASVQGHEEEETREQNTIAVVGPDVQRVSDRLRSATPPPLLFFPPHETGALPFFCSCYSLCHRSAPERDLHVQSFTSISAERLSLCLLLTSHGKQQKTILEAPRSALVHLEQLLTEQVEKGVLMLAHTCGQTAVKKTSLCSPLESIPGSVTTVDAQREDDISESQWRLQTCLSFDVSSSKCGGELWDWHFDRNGPPAWTLNSCDLDTFRTLFDPEFCRTPFLAGFLGLDYGPFLVFHAGGFMRDKNTLGKNAPDMEEHLAVMHERLRHELPNFFLKRHEYGMYCEDMEFENGILRMKTRGRPMYKAVLTVFRFLAWNYFADVNMEVLKLTQHPENWSIQARWRVIGLPFHVLFFRFYRKDKTELYSGPLAFLVCEPRSSRIHRPRMPEALYYPPEHTFLKGSPLFCRCYDAHSTFYLGTDGLIRYHKVDKVMTAQPPIFKAKRLLAAILVALGIADHRPALNLLLLQPFFRTGQKHC